MKCLNCGAPMNENDAFCGSCGCPRGQVKAKEQTNNTNVAEEKKKFDPLNYDANKANTNDGEKANNNNVNKVDNKENNVPNKENVVVNNQASNGFPLDPAKDRKQYVPKPPVAPPQPPINPPAPNTKTIKINKKAIIAVVVVFAVIVAACIGLGIAKSQFKPEKIAKDFADALSQSQWDDVYDMMQMSESDFVNKDGFIKMCQDYPEAFGVDFSECSSYTIAQGEYEEPMGDADSPWVNKSNDDSFTSYEMRCRVQNDSESVYFSVVKIEDGFWFFDKYAVELDESPVTSYDIYAPKGSVVKVNDIELTAHEKQSDNGYITNVYTIENILPGTYSISVTKENCTDYVADFSVYKYGINYDDALLNDADGRMYDGVIENGGTRDNRFYCSLYYEDEYLNNMKKFAEKIGYEIVVNTANGSNDISKIPASDDTAKTRIQEEVNENVDRIKSDGSSEYVKYGKISVEHSTNKPYHSSPYCFWMGTQLEAIGLDTTIYYNYSYVRTYTSTWDGSVTETKTENNDEIEIVVIPDDAGEFKVLDIDFYMYR